MYLKSVMIQNYRKYGTKDNVVTFASNRSIDSNSVLNSTLIVGQNNAGKTSIVKALQKACGDNKERFSFTDFNYYYLRDLLSIGIKKKEQIQTYISDPSAAVRNGR